MKKFMLRVMPVVLVVALVLTSTVYGAALKTITDFAGTIRDTVLAVVRIVAVIAIAIAGARYMLAGADKKAEIKDSIVVIVVGGVLALAATGVVDLIANLGSEIK